MGCSGKQDIKGLMRGRRYLNQENAKKKKKRKEKENASVLGPHRKDPFLNVKTRSRFLDEAMLELSRYPLAYKVPEAGLGQPARIQGSVPWTSSGH